MTPPLLISYFILHAIRRAKELNCRVVNNSSARLAGRSRGNQTQTLLTSLETRGRLTDTRTGDRLSDKLHVQ